MHLVLFRQNDFRWVEGTVAFQRWPFDANGGIVPHEAALVVRMIDVVTLIAELGLVGEHKEAVREMLRNEELALVLRGENHALPLAVGRAAVAQVNRHVENRAAHDAHELGLRMLNLEMEASQHTLGARRLVILDEIDVDAARHEVRLLVGFHEVAAVIPVALHVDDNHASDGRLSKSEVTALDGIPCCHD